MDELSLYEGVYVDNSFSNGWVIRQSKSSPGRFYYLNIYSNEKSWDVPACLEKANAVHSSPPKTVSTDSIENDEIICNEFGLNIVSEQFCAEEHCKGHRSRQRCKEWCLKEIESSIFPCTRHSEKILRYYKKNVGVIIDFSLLPAPSVVNETVVSMSSKRRAVECSSVECSDTEREDSSYRSKRVRSHTSSSFSASDAREEYEAKSVSVRVPEVLKSIGKPGQSPNETAGRSTSTKDLYQTSGRPLPNQPGRFSKSTSSTKESAGHAQKTTVLKDDSWHGKQRDDSSTHSQQVSIQKNVSPTSTAALLSKTWQTEVKVNRAQNRLALLQQQLKRDQESKDHTLGKSPSHTPVTPKASLNKRLAFGSGNVSAVQISGTTTKTAQVPKSSAAETYNSLSTRPPESLKRRSSDVQKLPVQVNSGRRSNDSYLSKTKESCPESKPSCSYDLSEASTQTEPSISYVSPSSSKKNLAAERLQRLQRRLSEESSEALAAYKTASSTHKQTNSFVQPGFPESESVRSKVQIHHEPSFLEIDAVRIDHTETNDNAFEEEMDWEPTDHQLNEMITDIYEIRSEIHGSSLIPLQSPSTDVIHASDKKSKYFIVLDSNILIGHLRFVEALRDRQFQDLEPLVLILPWVVIQELDKLKDWNPNRRNGNHNAMTSSLARAAVKWINLQLQGKHPRVKGQASFNRTGPMMACEVADDSILVCCKEMEPFARHVVLLTEDVNLQNKALMLDIQVRSQKQLKTQLEKLEKLPHSSSSSNSGAVSSRDVLTESVVSPEEAEKADNILCEVKIGVRDYLTEVARLELKAVYGNEWMALVRVQPPWLTMVEVVQVIVDLWRAVFGYVCHDRRKLTLYQELYAFLNNEKAYDHSLKKVHHFISVCIEAIFALPIKSDRAIQEGCLDQLKQLQHQCKSLPAKAVNLAEDILIIEKPLERAWKGLWIFCFVSCEFLGIKHEIPIPPEVDTIRQMNINLDVIKSDLVKKRIEFTSLIFSLQNVLNIPVNQLSASSKAVQDLHGMLTQLSLENDHGEQYPTIETFTAYCADENSRKKISNSIEQYRNFESYMMSFDQRLM